MRGVFHNILIFIFLLNLLASCGRQNPAQRAINLPLINIKKIPGKIAFDKEIHNFGTLKDGEIVAYSFKFRNKGGSSFKISKAIPSCGCIEVKFGETEILPGDSSVITVIFNTSGEWGNQLKEARIETSDGRSVVLSVGAYIDNKQFNNLLNN